ncbi:MAG: type II toxin-antitoxin system HicA family toxin [Tissierellaceae bacterium]
MKRREYIRLLESNGWKLKREGGNHTIYEKDGVVEEVPRHREINERLARNKIKELGLK